MGDLRPDEEFARQTIEGAAGCPVRQYDDGSRPSMHDLVIDFEDGSAAVEVVAAVDGPTLALGKAMDRRGDWIVPGLRGGWLARLAPAADARKVRKHVPAILRSLDAAGLDRCRGDGRDWMAPDESKALRELDVLDVRLWGSSTPGRIFHVVDNGDSGGWLADTGDAVATWVGDYLADDARSDVRYKLAVAATVQRHAFVIVPTFVSVAPFDVMNLLIHDGEPLPTVPPELPVEITHVWVASTSQGGAVFRWSADGGWDTVPKMLS